MFQPVRETEGGHTGMRYWKDAIAIFRNWQESKMPVGHLRHLPPASKQWELFYLCRSISKESTNTSIYYWETSVSPNWSSIWYVPTVKWRQFLHVSEATIFVEKKKQIRCFSSIQQRGLYETLPELQYRIVFQARLLLHMQRPAFWCSESSDNRWFNWWWCSLNLLCQWMWWASNSSTQEMPQL